MSIVYRYLIPALWLAWLAYWRISAADVKAAQRVEPPWSRAAHLLPLLIAAVLLWIRTDPDGGWLFHRFLSRSAASFWIGALLTGIGLAFSVWARVHLGRNWSATGSVKQDHELVRSGPYALVRHPMYVGGILVFVGIPLMLGSLWGLMLIHVLIAAVVARMLVEEHALVRDLTGYGDYMARVRWRLVPYLW